MAKIKLPFGLERNNGEAVTDASEIDINIEGQDVPLDEVVLYSDEAEDIPDVKVVEGDILMGNAAIRVIDNDVESSGKEYKYGNFIVDTQKNNPNVVSDNSRATVVIGRGNKVKLYVGDVIGNDNIVDRLTGTDNPANNYIIGIGNNLYDARFNHVHGQANGVKGEYNNVVGVAQSVNGTANSVMSSYVLDFYFGLDIKEGKGGATTYTIDADYFDDDIYGDMVKVGQTWMPNHTDAGFRVIAVDKEAKTVTFDRTISNTDFASKMLLCSNIINGNRNTVIGGTNNFINLIKQTIIGWSNVVRYSNKNGNTGYSDWGGVTIGCWNDPNKGGRIVFADGGTTKRHTAMVIDMSGNIEFTPKEGAKMTYNGSEVMTKGDIDLSQVNLPNDRDSLVAIINRLEKRTEMLANIIKEQLSIDVTQKAETINDGGFSTRVFPWSGQEDDFYFGN